MTMGQSRSAKNTDIFILRLYRDNETVEFRNDQLLSNCALFYALDIIFFSPK